MGIVIVKVIGFGKIGGKVKEKNVTQHIAQVVLDIAEQQKEILEILRDKNKKKDKKDAKK